MQAAHPEPDAHETDDNQRYAHVGRDLPQLIAKSPDEQRDKRTDEYTQLNTGAVGGKNFAAVGQQEEPDERPGAGERVGGAAWELLLSGYHRPQVSGVEH